MAWPSVKGTITKLSFIDHSDPDDLPGTSFIVNLEYSYHVKGNNYIGTDINKGIWLWIIDEKGRKWFEKNRKSGTQVDVFYNPDHPSEAVLIKGMVGSESQTLYLALIIIFGGIISFITAIKHKDTRN